MTGSDLWDDDVFDDEAQGEVVADGIDPRFLKRNGELKSNETISQLKLEDKVRQSFRDFNSAPPVFWGDRQAWEQIRFSLPMPPSVNRWTRVWKGQARASESAKAYMQEASNLFKQWGIKPLPRMYAIDVVLHGLPARSDVDGRNKQIFDCMQGTVVFDDYQFRDQRCRDGRTPKAEPHIVVTITIFEEESE
jgi:Holliday junction resolvase RusA-like endonuclease